MVATDNKPSGILKLALRTFLDKQVGGLHILCQFK